MPQYAAAFESNEKLCLVTAFVRMRNLDPENRHEEQTGSIRDVVLQENPEDLLDRKGTKCGSTRPHWKRAGASNNNQEKETLISGTCASGPKVCFATDYRV